MATKYGAHKYGKNAYSSGIARMGVITLAANIVITGNMGRVRTFSATLPIDIVLPPVMVVTVRDMDPAHMTTSFSFTAANFAVVHDWQDPIDPTDAWVEANSNNGSWVTVPPSSGDWSVF